MKLLISVSSIEHLHVFIQSLGLDYDRGLQLQTFSVQHHELSILVTGEGSLPTCYQVTKTLITNRYHLALHFTLGTSYKTEHTVGSVLNVVNEKSGDAGKFIDGIWNDYYDLGLTSREDYPHVRGGFINLNSAYLNVFLPYKKAVGLTVNYLEDQSMWTKKQEKYRADCETKSGLGFVYPCLSERQGYYHLTVIEHNLVSQDRDTALALNTLNSVALEILKKL